MPLSGSFVQSRLDLVDPRHGQPGGVAGAPPVYPDGSVDEGQAWAQALGGAQDQEMALLRVAQLSRLPRYVPDDGLDQLGNGALALERYPGESDDQYRARLENAPAAYQVAASALAIQQQLQAFGFVDVVCLPVWQSPGPFLPETSATSYSEFYLKLGPNFGTTGIVETVFGSCTFGNCLFGSSMTAAQLGAVKRIVMKWKAAPSYPVKLFLDFGAGWSNTDALYNIGRTFGDTCPAFGDSAAIFGGYQL